MAGCEGGLTGKGDIPNGPIDREVGGNRGPFLSPAVAADKRFWGEESKSLWRWNASSPWRPVRPGRPERNARGSRMRSWSNLSGSLSFNKSLASWEAKCNTFVSLFITKHDKISIFSRFFHENVK